MVIFIFINLVDFHKFVQIKHFVFDGYGIKRKYNTQ